MEFLLVVFGLMVFAACIAALAGVVLFVWDHYRDFMNGPRGKFVKFGLGFYIFLTIISIPLELSGAV